MIQPEALPFTRVSGADNTFFVVNMFDSLVAKIVSAWKPEQKINWIKKICDSYYGFKTNGVLFLKETPGHDFTWDFYNSDGSTAEMCGNAARCAAYYYFHRVKNKAEISFLTEAGLIHGQVLGHNWVQVEMTATTDEKPNLEVEGYGSGYFINTGVPHFVVESRPDKEWARKVRFHPVFGKAGSNVTFVTIRSWDKAEAVTYERGVEDFTQACGTGAVAAAMYLKFKAPKIESAKIQMPGGELIVENLELGQRPLLIGGAQFEFELRHYGEESGDLT